MYTIVLKSDRHLDSYADDTPVKFQSDPTILKFILAASRLCENLLLDVLCHGK